MPTKEETCHIPSEQGFIDPPVGIGENGIACPYIDNTPGKSLQCELLNGDCQFAQAVAEILQQAEIDDRCNRAQRSFQELGVRVRDGKAVWGS